MEKLSAQSQRAGNLLVILDLTESRAESLRQAQQATALMFAAIKRIGSIALRLVYFRGLDECKAMGWQTDSEVVTRAMLTLSCLGGYTQIARALRAALNEQRRLDGVVFIGDNCEDNPEELRQLSAQLGARKIPLFVFHEINEKPPGHEYWSIPQAVPAEPVFRDMAQRSGGVYAPFRSDSGRVLQEMLSTVAGFVTAGAAGVKQLRKPTTQPALELQNNLLRLQAPRKAG